MLLILEHSNVFSDASRRIESELFHFLFPIRIKDNRQRPVFVIIGAGNVPLLYKPGS